MTASSPIWSSAGSARYDAIVLDVMMPGLDGIATCRRLRDEDVWAPVLTARDAIEDRVAGLDAGADDDYLTKPFALIVSRSGARFTDAGSSSTSGRSVGTIVTALSVSYAVKCA
jgi:DNA-binding response OmpR family regulator